MLIKFIKFTTTPFIFIYGYLYFLLKKKNLKNINSTFVNVYCLTKGLSNLILNSFTILNYKIRYFLSPKKTSSYINQYKNKIENINSTEIISQISESGYSIINEFLKKYEIEEILKLTHNTKCSYILNDEIIKSASVIDVPSQATIIDIDENELLKQKIIQDLVHNDFFYDISKNYFKSIPILTNVGLRISKISDKPGNKEAQLYHFDLDRPKWLKFFIYLNDVENLDHGPHSYIKNTHKVFAKPYKILIKRYQRISDKEIFSYYNQANEHIIYGKAGTLAIGDTLAFHKGHNPRTKNRKVLTLEFSNSLFGSYFENYEVAKNIFKSNNTKFEEKFYSKFI